MSYSVAMLSVHTSPLDTPGRTRDAGGMNVYIHELARELGHSQNTIDIFTRRTNEYSPHIVQLTPHVRVIHVKAGPSAPIHKHEIYQYLSAFAQHVDEFRRSEKIRYDILHSHYWLSGVMAMQLALLLRAAAMMEQETQVVIVGGNITGDKEIEQLQELATHLKISKRVHFTGARPQHELSMIYSAADVTVIPSYYESFGLAAVESLACGTPVVATRAGGLTTIVHHGETGYLVPRCPGFFAERLDTLLQNPDLLEHMRLAARPSILQFSWKNVASQMEGVYEDVISEAARCLVAQ